MWPSIFSCVLMAADVSSTGVSPTTYFRFLFFAALGPLSFTDVLQQSSAVFTACAYFWFA